MPSRAWVVTQDNCQWRWYSPFQCPLGLELLLHDLAFCWDENVVSMPSRAWVVTLASLIWLSSLQSFNALSGLSCYRTSVRWRTKWSCFNALSGLYLISTKLRRLEQIIWKDCVNALSGLYLISTLNLHCGFSFHHLVSMPSRAYTSFLRTPSKT